MNQQNFKLSDFGIEKPNWDLNAARNLQNTCGFAEFKVRPLAAEYSSQVRINFEGLETTPSPESNCIAASPNLFWKQYGGQESGVIIAIRNKSLKVVRKTDWNGRNDEEDLICESPEEKRGKSRQSFVVLIFNSNFHLI